MRRNKKNPQKDIGSIWIEKNDTKFEVELADAYKKDQICVFFKVPSEENINKVKEYLERRLKKVNKEQEIESKEIEVRKCSGCDCPVVLFKGSNLHTIITTRPVETGSVEEVPNVGEEYSLNFYEKIPFEKKNKLDLVPVLEEHIGEKKDKIVVAVLDTGFDKGLVDERYLWKNTNEDSESNCYKDAVSGWNFVNISESMPDGTSDFHDDHEDKHGSIISQFIIDEFRNSPCNSVEIMPLKTHNDKGLGDLFGIFCAIYFAMVKGANIINASWGFYAYFEDPFPLMSQLIKELLHKRGILFITAAGNKFEEEEEIARKIFLELYGGNATDEQLRNLDIHHFYPAHLSKVKPGDRDSTNNVLTITTTNGKEICPTQNFSEKYVDLGVEADVDDDEGMRFQVPFPCEPPDNLISGSSFATAIATGVIGAYCPKELFSSPLIKSKFIDTLSSYSGKGRGSAILDKKNKLAKNQIKEGKYIQKRLRRLRKLR